jgi:hypothetical protein
MTDHEARACHAPTCVFKSGGEREVALHGVARDLHVGICGACRRTPPGPGRRDARISTVKHGQDARLQVVDGGEPEADVGGDRHDVGAAWLRECECVGHLRRPQHADGRLGAPQHRYCDARRRRHELPLPRSAPSAVHSRETCGELVEFVAPLVPVETVALEALAHGVP